MSAPQVSIILPVHNVAPHIGRCIESLRDQTVRELEFIFVDDCSTDSSMAEVEAWAAEDGRVRILRNGRNLGAGPSRNRGIGAARGDYLSFVDPDDYVSPDFYELLYAAATANGGHDIAKGARVMVNELGNVLPLEGEPLNARMRLQLERGSSLYTAFTYEHQTALYRHALFTSGDVRYGASRNSQDTTFLLACCLQADDLVFQEEARYFYVQREGSAIRRNGVARTNSEIDAVNEKFDILEARPLNREARQYMCMQVQTCLRRFQALLGRGLVTRDDYESVANRLTDALRRIPKIERECKDRPQLKELLTGRPLTTPGLRNPGEGNVRISVILPIYNPGTGVAKCIESLRSQLLDGLEFVFVDDCSTDGSMAEVEAWAAEDGRVRILRNGRNLGAGPSCNRGIGAARGDYLSFVDPGDSVSASFYLLLYAAARAKGGHDMAKGICETITMDGTRSQNPSELLNERIQAARHKRVPLFTAFSTEHQTAIYRRSLFERGAIFGTTKTGEGTTFLLSACLLSEDIALDKSAVYRQAAGCRPLANFRPLNPDITELDSVIEKVALLWERPHDPRTKHYLEAQLAELITSFYVDRHGCPSLPDDLNDYSREFANMVNYLTALGFLTGKNPYYGALVDHQTLLPLVDSLPVELKAEGALDWMSFVKQAPHGGKIYLSACAQAQEAALRHVAQEQGLRAFRIAYDRVISQVDELSLKPRAALLLELHRKLASWRNVRKALGKARGKLLLSRTCL